MSNKTHEITNKDLDKAIEEFNALDRLMIKKSRVLPQNLIFLSKVLIDIRFEAENSYYLLKEDGIKNIEIIKSIKNIIELSDALHNVGTFTAIGNDISAEELYINAHMKNRTRNYDE